VTGVPWCGEEGRREAYPYKPDTGGFVLFRLKNFLPGICPNPSFSYTSSEHVVPVMETCGLKRESGVSPEQYPLL